MACSGPQDYGIPAADFRWHDDILGDGFKAKYVSLGESYDGPVRCTVIYRRSAVPSCRAVLYVHGYNDYFFQSEMGKEFCDSGFNFYAVDLRRYGRSLLPWQYPFDIRDMQDYFADIDSALSIIRRHGNRDITLSGHSTGGLTVLLYAAVYGKECPVQRIVTDSPFLEWNFSPLMRHVAIPTVSLLGKIIPSVKIKQKHCDGYAYSLLKDHHGLWEYNTKWKMVYSPPVTAGWISAISRAQLQLMRHSADIAVPVLVMHSSRVVDGCGWTPSFQHGDAVLDPAMIAKRGARLGRNPVVRTIDGGLHDLILSTDSTARRQTYATIFSFIRDN